MKHPPDLVGWVVDILHGTGWHWTPQQILDTEAAYPGLLDDIATELWVRGLMKAQADG